MPRPIPVIASVAEVTTLPSNVALDGTGSTPSAGAASITGYLWVLLERPPGSAAYLEDETTATPTLRDVDVHGTYTVFLVVTDDLGAESYPNPVAQQGVVPPYHFESPVSAAFVAVRAPLASGLVNPAKGEYGWLQRCLWPVTEEADKLREQMDEVYDQPNKKVMADEVVPQTPGALDLNGLEVTNGASHTDVASGPHDSIRVDSVLRVIGNNDFRVEPTGRVLTDTVLSVTGGNINSLSGITTPQVLTPRVYHGAETKLEGPGADFVAGTNASVVSTGEIVLDCGGRVSIESSATNVEVRGQTGVSLLATTGDITLDAPDAGGSVDITALSDVTLTSTAGNVELRPRNIPTSSAVGRVDAHGVVASRNRLETLTSFDPAYLLTTEVFLAAGDLEFPAHHIAVGDVVKFEIFLGVSEYKPDTNTLFIRVYAEFDSAGVPEQHLIGEYDMADTPGGVGGAVGVIHVRGSVQVRSTTELMAYSTGILPVQGKGASMGGGSAKAVTLTGTTVADSMRFKVSAESNSGTVGATVGAVSLELVRGI